ncbi:hypothetical protein L3X38_044607 [Prunus dulcis]|uniref:glucan endo-1,3-beta-D-glucosidase n=1 Tax=Prunus dulcis TaxID=3755 RepID=A0AAD4V0F5_PRUDU|nr:hypothetical protein L3X38_044607 [Prunus dulcis]
MLAHPLHLHLLSNATVLEDFKYKTIDGDLVGIVGDLWELKSHNISVTWHSIGGVKQASYPEIVYALCRDVRSTPITTESSYFYGKLVARAAKLALIVEEVDCLDGNTWRTPLSHGWMVLLVGMIFLLAKIDRAWGSKYKPQAYSLAADFINMGNQSNSNYPRLRCFDLYKLHSWAGGLAEFGDGRDQESTSEAVNAYYSAALMGLAYGDTNLFDSGSMLTALEIQAAQMWWHVREGDTLYEEEFTKENRIVGILWANKRDGGLWFAPPEAKEIRLGIQLLEGIYDKDGASEKIKSLKGFDDGNSLT